MSSIQKGVCVLVGVGADDNERDIDTIVNKILNIRVFEDEQGTMWKKGVKDLGLEVLCGKVFTEKGTPLLLLLLLSSNGFLPPF